MHDASAWFALGIAGVGWFYLFGSQSATRLRSLEAHAVNRRRIVFRCLNGACLILLATCFFAGIYTIRPADRPRCFVADWSAVMVLLLISVALALVDLRLTARLRRSRDDREGE